jgi:hypothetical protein
MDGTAGGGPEHNSQMRHGPRNADFRVSVSDVFRLCWRSRDFRA